MSYITWRALQLLRAFFVWLMQPHVLAVGFVCVALGIFTWYLINDPVFGLAVRTFFLNTLPRWFDIAVAYLTRTAVQRQFSRISTRLLQVVAFQWIAHWIEHLLEARIECWKDKTAIQKSMWIGSVICLLWLMYGWWWLLAFFPYELLRSMVVGLFRFVVNWLGVGPLLKRIENRVAVYIPKRIKYFFRELDELLKKWVQTTRTKLEQHRHIQRMEVNARKRVYRLRQKRRAKQKEKGLHTRPNLP